MKKILLVDDEESILLLNSEELEDEGFTVDTALNGEIGLRKFQATAYDLVILDINMPGMNGIEVLRQIKAIKNELPVIICSAYPEYKEDINVFLADEYIVKSANTEEIVNSVTKLLEN